MRKIIHIDCDCFYASVEMRDDPSLRDLPIAIGGQSDRRGVVATCNYPAREYGVRSAMASAHARRLCPSLILIPPRMDKYREAAEQIRKIFFSYTELVEPLSQDEAFLDVSDCEQCRGSATLIAQEIRQRIASEVGVTASAGIAPNKFLAKIASDWHKPNGQLVITPDEVPDFVRRLPVNKIFGVGKVTAKKLERMGILTCGELQQRDLTALVESFGVFGQRLYQLSRGEDNRPVKPHRRRKSLSVEHTYAADLPDANSCLKKLPELLVELKGRLRRVDDSYQVVRQFVKVKFNDFAVTTLERAHDPKLSLDSFAALLQEAFPRGNRPVRLLGIGVRFVDLTTDHGFVQLELFAR
ncbi:DNA polymerase IV [Porticoccus sp. W117]|uniref:DNA polymerase IV n=1 Tax=Porticoccus sp. W117 TaxID=3054777 RepID=UPI002596439A|nr:DNA polymerase IV [Porticoccus sp. W117]MDM3869973.1 DNA polymerase IV [Porticoccus sp. W117]